MGGEYINRNNLIACCVLSPVIVLLCCLFSGYEGIGGTAVLAFICPLLLCWIKNKSDIGVYSFSSELYVIYLIRLLLIVVVFYLGWRDTLSTANAVASYDPARYYYQALEMINNGFLMKSGQVNYVGIIYWYAILMKIFGANPFVPLLINNLLSITSGVLLFSFVYDFESDEENRKLRLFYVGFCFLPELIWYDCLSSRETICMALIVIISTCLYKIFINNERNLLLFITLILGVVLLGFIRFSLVTAILLMVVIYMASGNGTVLKKIFTLAIMVVGVFLISWLGTKTGSTRTDLLSIVTSDTTGTSVLSDQGLNWSENSIGKMLIADSTSKMILLSPIRMLVYLIAPLPSLGFTFEGLSKHIYSSWQGLFVFISTIWYLISFPKLASNFVHGIIYRKNTKWIMYFFLIMLFVVAAGTQVIHERYRIIVIPWIYLAIVTANQCEDYERLRGRFYCGCLGLLCIIAYVMIKFL